VLQALAGKSHLVTAPTSISGRGYPSRACSEFCTRWKQSGLVIATFGRRALPYQRQSVPTCARKRDRYDGVAEAAAPILDRLCQKVSWPSDLMVPAGDHLEIRESRPRAHALRNVLPAGTGSALPVNWALSAVGRAYLAFCPESERQKILALLRKSDRPEDRLARDARRVRPDSGRDTREGIWRARSFVQRRRLWASDSGRPAGDAVPLLDRGHVHGVINIIWVQAARDR